MTASKLFSRIFALILLITSITSCFEPLAQGPATGAQANITNDRFSQRPRLVVGITVDQMRLDYLYRYWHLFGNDGFKRLVNDGFICTNHHFDYGPTVTAPGHASIYTGTTPAIHGIIANDWHERNAGNAYCTSDSTVFGVGTMNEKGKMSPHRMLTSTVSDELRLSNNFKSKVIGISMKDRGAILPAGHAANGAYWFVFKDEGNWVTSSYYTDVLPQWVQDFNAKRLPDSYIAQGWKLLLAPEVYDISYIDNNPYEGPFRGQLRAAFPYDFSSITENKYDVLGSAPHGSSLSVDFALAAIAGEGLGTDEHTDLLALSFSSPDYAGHQFGPQSMEVQDTYLRLDRDIARLLQYLDKNVGDNQYAVFLTADHGGAAVPGYTANYGIPGGYWRPQAMLDDVNQALQKQFGAGEWIEAYSNDQIFFNTGVLEKYSITADQASAVAAPLCKGYDEVLHVYTKTELLGGAFTDLIVQLTQRGIHPQRSGDLIVVTRPGYIEHSLTGTTHGSPFSYDTHVPLIFFGQGIQAGELSRRTNTRDIAPTVARLMRVAQPSGCTGDVIHELVD